MRLTALYVEDEVGGPSDRFQREIEKAGFLVTRAYSAEEAREAYALSLRGDDFFDLVVLDRKLPERVAGNAGEGVGDELFQYIESSSPDVPIIVLTGFSSESSARMVLQRENSLRLGPRRTCQRVAQFRKIDALDFTAALTVIGSALRETENVSLEGDVTSRSTRRILKRVAQSLGASVLWARPAVSGLSEAAVWLCDANADDGRHLASVVVKISTSGAPWPSGGFMVNLPHVNVAHPREIVEGACGGGVGQVAPLVGPSGVSLSTLLGQNQVLAAGAAAAVARVLDEVSHSSGAPLLRHFMAPLLDWELACALADKAQLALPRPDLAIPSQRGCLHGDLHPGNVLMLGNTPVFIDFDRQREGPVIMDTLTLALGAIFHKSGPLRSSRLTVDGVVEALFGAGVGDGWLSACTVTWDERGFGEREKWGAILAYSLRQLKYDDVVGDPFCLGLARELCVRAALELERS